MDGVYFLLPVIPISLLLIRTNRLDLLMVLFLSLFSGSRMVGVDIDSVNYLNLWFKSYSLDQFSKEPISKLIFHVVYNFGLEINFAFFIFSFLTLLLLYKTCRKFNADFKIFILIYLGYFFIVQNMMQIRIALALSIMSYSLCYYDKCNKKFAIGFLLSILTHQSIAVCIIPCLICKIKRTEIMLYTASVALSIQIISVFDYDIVGMIINFFEGFVSSQKYETYSNSYLKGYYINTFSILNLFNVTLLSLSTFCYIAVRNEEIKEIEKYITFGWCGIIAICLLKSLPSFGFRISEIFIFFNMFAISTLFNHVGIKTKSTITIILLLFSYLSIYKVLESQVVKEYSTFFGW